MCVLQTAEVVQFILVKDQKKIPIRRAGRAARRLRAGARVRQEGVCGDMRNNESDPNVL